MTIDLSKFYKHNIIDTCAIWNVLSSELLYNSARSSGVVFICTIYVNYECLIKPRKTASEADSELRNRLVAAKAQNDFVTYSLDIEDLQTIEILRKRRQLGMGELSSLAMSLKTRQALLTDDQKARRLSIDIFNDFKKQVSDHPGHQTTPHLVGWLFYSRILSDADKKTIIDQHNALNRPLEKYFCEMYNEALRCRYLSDRKQEGR